MIALAILGSTALVCATAIVLRLTARQPDPAQSLGAFVVKMSEQHAREMHTAYQLTLETAIGDRDRLLNAALASLPDTHVLQRVGSIDQINARRPMQMGPDGAAIDPRRNGSQTVEPHIDPDTREPVIPVGLESQ